MPPKILLIEDNEMNRDALARLLGRGGFEVVTAATGLEGVEQARKLRPQLILMDLGLPEIDGLEVTRRVRSDPTTRDIPIIALTAHAQQSDKHEALAAGCNDFDTKPVKLERLVGKMMALLPGNGATDREPRTASGGEHG